MFGNSIDDDGYQRLNTPMIPVSPYAKVLGYNEKTFQRSVQKICNGIFLISIFRLWIKLCYCKSCKNSY